jgi:hypothetical protein
VVQFSHLVSDKVEKGEDALEFYKQTYEDMLTLINSGKEVEASYLEQDTT